MAEISLFIKEYRMFIEIFRIFFTWLFASLPSKKSGGSQFVNGQLAFILRKPENGRFRGYAKLSKQGKIDFLRTRQYWPFFVIPAKAGIRSKCNYSKELDSGSGLPRT